VRLNGVPGSSHTDEQQQNISGENVCRDWMFVTQVGCWDEHPGITIIVPSMQSGFGSNVLGPIYAW